jgi:CDGSH-type Zn-finger protein
MTDPLIAQGAPFVLQLAEARTVAWCGCKHSKTKPFCDGTHKTLPR